MHTCLYSGLLKVSSPKISLGSSAYLNKVQLNVLVLTSIQDSDLGVKKDKIKLYIS